MDMIFKPTDGTEKGHLEALRSLLDEMRHTFKRGDRIGIKLHWGEHGNHSYLDPMYCKEIVEWLVRDGMDPFICDTTVLYSGGRRNGKDSLKTASQHGFTPEYLGCDVVIADGMEGRDVIDIPTSYKHFKSVQVASILDKASGFVIFSHFKAHLGAGFGGAIKNLSMGFASRAQKQRMHADAKPVLNLRKCTRCGVCADVCPVGAARIGVGEEDYPSYDLEKCIGCAQCIAMCPEMALRVSFASDMEVFQEKLVETAHEVWKKISKRAVLVNAMIKISSECDCLPGKPEYISNDIGFLGGYDPVKLDSECLKHVGEDVISAAHPGIPWRRQFTYAEEIGFSCLR
jgi:uncharacterized Fe-S center protein